MSRIIDNFEAQLLISNHGCHVLEVSGFTPDPSYILFKSVHFAESAEHELNSPFSIIFDRPTDRPTERQIDWPTDRPTDWVTDNKPTHQPSHRPTVDRPSDRLTDGSTDRPTERHKHYLCIHISLKKNSITKVWICWTLCSSRVHLDIRIYRTLLFPLDRTT